MKRSLKAAKSRISKQKKTIQEQRLLIRTLRQAQKELKQKTHPVELNDDNAILANQFILSQLSKQQVSKFARRYNDVDKNFALALHYYSPQCYKMLRKIFVLPTTRSLSKWLENIDVRQGFNEPVLEMLKIKANVMTVQDRLCTIVFDEMSLKKLITYNSLSDEFEGFVNDMMTGQSDNVPDGEMSDAHYQEDELFSSIDEKLNIPQLANQAMVILVRGINSDFKQVIGYFLAHDAMPGERLKEIVLESIRKIQWTGLVPKVVVTDQGSNNISMRCQLGISEAKPFVGIGGERIFFFYDSPHILKSVRNNFKSYDIVYDGAICQWKDVVDFYNIDKNLPHRLAPKLSSKHMDLPPFSPMRVCLAAETMSHTVASGILTLISLNHQGVRTSAVHTAKFIDFVDSLFDVFNSCSINNAKVLKRCLKVDSAHWQFLKEAKESLKSLKVMNKTQRNPACIEGWIMNISALEMLWKDLLDTSKVQYLFTRRLTQDCIENIFSTVRLRGGNNTRPDASKFRHTLNKPANKSIGLWKL